MATLTARGPRERTGRRGECIVTKGKFFGVFRGGGSLKNPTWVGDGLNYMLSMGGRWDGKNGGMGRGLNNLWGRIREEQGDKVSEITEDMCGMWPFVGE